jgi:serine/threonine protein kinase
MARRMNDALTGDRRHAAPPLPPGNDSSEKPMRQATRDPLPKQARLAEFEILETIAAGDFGVLYRARDHLLDRDVTLREYLPPGFAQRDDDGVVSISAERDEELFAIGLRGFIDEARLLGRLEHPALMKVYRFWEANGTAYMAMPFHAGITLETAMCNGRAPKAEREIATLLAEPLDALRLLHDEGRVHGGVAPDAILLRPDGRGLLLDIGAARKTLVDLALTPGAMQKPGFAALEQYEVIPGLKPGPWTDAYAVAAVAYSLLAGMPPPDAETRSERDAMLPASEAGKGRASERFLDAIDAALALMPQDRTASAAALREALGMPAAARGAAAAEPHRTPFPAATPIAAPAAAPTAAIPPMPPSEAPSARLAQRMPARKPRRRIPEAVFVVFIAAAVYAGFRILSPHDAGQAPPAAAVLASKAPETPAAKPVPAPATPAAPAAGAAPSAAAHADATPPAGNAAAPAPAASAPATSAPVPQPPVPPIASNAPATPAPQAAAPARTAAPTLPPRPAQVASAPPDAALRAEERREETSWLSAQSIDTAAAYESFLASFPESSHAPAARVMLARLRWEQRQADASRPHAAPPAAAPARPEAPRAAPVRAAQAPRIEDRIAIARPPQTAPLAVPPAERPAETATMEGGSIRLQNQTMTGDFRPDPVTGAVSGRGRIAWDNGDRFDGTLVRGVKEGRGEFVWANGQRYSGDWSGGLPNGRGAIQFPNGNRYEGEMRNGAPNGVGTIVFANGNRYTGEVRNGLPNGHGTNRFANGDTYSGDWRMGKSDGHGRYTWANGDAWEGEFRNGAQTANGRMASAARERSGAASASGPSANASAASGASDADDPFLK